MANNYPVWWDKTLTVYNKFVDPSTHAITWYRKKLTNCFWKYSESSVTVGETTLKSNTTICRVPKNSLFMEKYDWEQSSATTRTNHFTFGPGDIIVNGDVADTINEYTAGQRSSDLLKKYKDRYGCMVVEQFSNDTGLGRGNEHYYIKGV